MISKAFGTAAEDDTSAILASALSAAQAEDIAVAAANPFVNGLVHVRHDAASGVAGGTFTSGSWQTRPLNTALTNQVTGASLASNQITLPAGTYLAIGWAQAYKVDGNQARIYDTTNSAELVLGPTATAASSNAGHTTSHVCGVFTLATQAVVEFQHRATTTQATNGMGVTEGWGTEVFADLMIWKLA